MLKCGYDGYCDDNQFYIILFDRIKYNFNRFLVD